MRTLPGLFLGGALGLLASVAAADSPLTSTDFASAYSDLKAVKEALRTHQVEGEALALLLSARPTDEKAAVVNAIGWQSPGSARAFVEGLASKRGVEVSDLKLAQLGAVDRFVLGYLRALETYLDPAPFQKGALDLWGATPLALFDQAAQALPDDFTVHYVRGLLEAQKAMADSTCSAYLATSRVLDRFPPRKRNLRPGAVDAIQAYMTLYKSGCDKAPIVAPANGASSPLSPEYDQIYSLARLGDTIVAGTQAGIVVWGDDRKRPLAHRDEAICTEVLVWNGAAWAGCYGRLVRFDGTAWKSYLPDPGAQDAYALWVNRNNQLRVYRGSEVWIYKQEEDGFAPARGFSEDTHHVLVRRNGDLWRVVFMKAIVGPRGPYSLRSPEYPGRDPRRLIEDGNGSLWVADFADGLLRLDENSGTFLPEPVLTEKAISVAVDSARDRTFVLQYLEGVRVQHQDRTEVIDLHDLENMRDLLLDDRSGDVWVAGWTGLVRLRESKGRWVRDDFRVGPVPAARPKAPPPPPPPKPKRTPR